MALWLAYIGDAPCRRAQAQEGILQNAREFTGGINIVATKANDSIVFKASDTVDSIGLKTGEPWIVDLLG